MRAFEQFTLAQEQYEEAVSYNRSNPSSYLALGYHHLLTASLLSPTAPAVQTGLDQAKKAANTVLYNLEPNSWHALLLNSQIEEFRANTQPKEKLHSFHPSKNENNLVSG